MPQNIVHEKVSMLTTAFVLSLEVFAQSEGMGTHNGNSSGSYSFSGTQMLLVAILLVLIIGGLVWFLINSKKGK